jgi:hypothetical protein
MVELKMSEGARGLQKQFLRGVFGAETNNLLTVTGRQRQEHINSALSSDLGKLQKRVSGMTIEINYRTLNGVEWKKVDGNTHIDAPKTTATDARNNLQNMADGKLANKDIVITQEAFTFADTIIARINNKSGLLPQGRKIDGMGYKILATEIACIYSSLDMKAISNLTEADFAKVQNLMELSLTGKEIPEDALQGMSLDAGKGIHELLIGNEAIRESVLNHLNDKKYNGIGRSGKRPEMAMIDSDTQAFFNQNFMSDVPGVKGKLADSMDLNQGIRNIAGRI